MSIVNIARSIVIRRERMLVYTTCVGSLACTVIINADRKHKEVFCVCVTNLLCVRVFACMYVRLSACACAWYMPSSNNRKL